MQLKYFMRTLFGSLFFSIIIFIVAGRLDYFYGYVFLIANLICGLFNYAMIRNDEALMNERGQVHQDSKKWDRQLLTYSLFTYAASICIAGLDSGRFHWSIPIHPPLSILGAVVMILGHLLFLFARKQNKFFSSIVRIQHDKGHEVCDQGLYRIIRHPGYAGMLISLISIPLICSSVWSIIPIFFSVVLLVIRTILEDKVLHEELSDYPAYSRKTKYKLIPFIW